MASDFDALGEYDDLPETVDDSRLAGQTLASAQHRQLHADLGAAIIKIEQLFTFMNLYLQANVYPSVAADGAPDAATVRTLGTGANQAFPGNGTRPFTSLSDVAGWAGAQPGDVPMWNGTQLVPVASGTTVSGPLAFTTTAINDATQSASYTFTVAATGGVAPYTYSSTALPAGLSLASSTGIISGTPTTAGTTAVTFTVVDDIGALKVKTMTMRVVAAAQPLAVATTSVPGGTATLVYAGATLAATGGTSPYTWTSTTLPAGLSLSSGGVLSGTPTVAGSTSVTFTVTDNVAATATKTMTVLVAAAPYDLAPNVYTKAAIVSGFEKIRCIDTNYTGYNATGGSGTGTWFVSPTGNDSTGNGTAATPYRTLTKALAATSTGHYVVLRAGTYREKIGSTSKQVTIQAYPHEEVWIKGSANYTNTAATAGLTVTWTAVANGYKLVPTLSVTTTNTSTTIDAGVGNFPFHAGMIDCKIAGTGIPAGATIASLSSGENTGADTLRYRKCVISAAATATGTVTATLGIGGALDRTSGTSGSVAFDSGLINTNPSKNATAGEPLGLFIDGEKMDRIVYNAATVLAARQYMYDSTNQVLYIGDNPATKGLIEATCHGYFVAATGANFTLAGLGIVHYGGNINPANTNYAAVRIDGNSAVVNSCTIALNHGYGFSFRNGSNQLIQNCLVLRNGSNGGHGTAISSWLMAGNRIAYNNDEYYDIGTGVGNFLLSTFAAVKVAGNTPDCIMYQNICHNNHANGLWFDRAPGSADNSQSQPSPASDCQMVLNISCNNDGHGFESEILERFIFAGNLAYGNGRDGCKLSSNPSSRVYHNTMYGNGWAGATPYTGARWWGDTAGSWQEFIHWIDARYGTFVHTYTGSASGSGDVKANILFSTHPSGATGSRVLRTANQKSTSTHAGTTLIASQNYNGFGRSAANLPQKLISYSTAGTTAQTTYNTLALFLAGLGAGREANAPTEQNGVSPITLFVSPSTGNFAPVASSAFDINGPVLPTDVADALGLTAGVAYKIGADTSRLLVPTWS